MSHSVPSVGSVVGGKYRLDRVLGEGGMGVVFAAENVDTGKKVAIKWMHAELAENPESAMRFRREAQASARVQHPNVVDVYDVLTDNGALFMVMQLLKGEPLTDYMERGTASMPELISLLLSAMRGVAAAHRQGIVHRDIKPDNIFLAREGDDPRPIPKVLDFGISKLSDTKDASITKTGVAMGTPLYMSVEQLSGVKDIDARTDIYAFGVILYQAITGQPPFDADSFPVLIAKIMTEQAVPPKQMRPEIPTTLSRLVEWAMAKNRDERVATLDELIQELEPYATDAGFRGQMTIAASSIPNVSTPSSRPRVAAPSSPAPPPVAVSVSEPPPITTPPPSAPPYASPFALAETIPPAPSVPSFAATEVDAAVPRKSLLPVALVLAGLFLVLGAWWVLRTPDEAAMAEGSDDANIVLPAEAPVPIAPVVPAVSPVEERASDPEPPAPSVAAIEAVEPEKRAPVSTASAKRTRQPVAHVLPEPPPAPTVATQPTPQAEIPPPAKAAPEDKFRSGFRASDFR